MSEAGAVRGLSLTTKLWVYKEPTLERRGVGGEECLHTTVYHRDTEFC